MNKKPQPGGLRRLSSFHSNGLGKIARLVHVVSPQNPQVIGEKLERDGTDNGSELFRRVRKTHPAPSNATRNKIAISHYRNHVSPAGSDLGHIGEHFFLMFSAPHNSDDGGAVFNERERSMLEFPSRVSVRVNVGYFFEFQSAFIRKRQTEAPA